MLRSTLFFIIYWVSGVVIGLSLFAISPLLSVKQVRGGVVFYCRLVTWALEHIGGVKIVFRGLEKLPEGPFILASKHQAWADGIAMVAKFGDIAFVVGAFIEKYFFVKGILKKAGAMVVDFQRGHKRGRRITRNFVTHAAEGRNILIYPEGGMVKIHDRATYKPGVYKFYSTTGWPVVPVATNLGLFWSCEDFIKEPGIAINEILDPIEPGLDQGEFMKRLELAINDNSKRLFEEGVKQFPYLKQKDAIWPDEVTMKTRYEN